MFSRTALTLLFCTAFVQAFLQPIIPSHRVGVFMGVGANSGSQARRARSIGLLSQMYDNVNSVPNPNQVMVSNLPFSASEKELEAFFSQAGSVVSAKIIIDRETGQSKGYGFVLFTEPLGATYALERLQGAELGGRPLKIRPAMRKVGGGERGGNNYRRREDSYQPDDE